MVTPTMVQPHTVRLWPCNVADRIMYVQLKTGYDLDGGPVLDLPRPLLQDLAEGVLPRANPAPIAGLLDANFYDVETKE
jgi:hypothetical protein